MPKAKFKRKGAPADVLAVLDSRQVKLKKLNICEVVNNQSEDASTGHKSDGSILNLPEEMICMILEHLPGGYINLFSLILNGNLKYYTLKISQL